MSKLTKFGAGILLLLCLGGCEYSNDLPLLSRFVAKNVCDGVYISGYDPAVVQKYVAAFAPPLKNSWNITLDEGAAATKVRNRWFPSLQTQTAATADADLIHGCRNLYNGVAAQTSAVLPSAQANYEFADNIDQFSELQSYVESVVNAGSPTNTTAILVVYDQQVVAESYRDGIGRNSPLKGFSMSKSFANLLVGRLTDKNVLTVQNPMPIADWQSDNRADITWDNSLRMNSGLAWHEAAIGKDNHQTQMLYGSADPSLYARSKLFAVTPGTRFNYSSGDFMNIATALVDQFPDWFDPGWDLDGHFSLEFTPDARYPLLPEGVSLTLRGWAQLASIYAQEGRLGNTQVLSPDWVHYSLTSTDTNGDYGAGIWLNRGQALFPALPSDAFAFIGAYDRYTVAIPSRKLIFVRIGYSEQPDVFNMQSFMQAAMAYLPSE